MKRSREVMIEQFKLCSEGHRMPAGEVYAAVEAPKGEFGVYLVSDRTTRPLSLQYPCAFLCHLQAIEAMTRKRMLADVAAIIGSLDIVFGEIDRLAPSRNQTARGEIS